MRPACFNRFWVDFYEPKGQRTLIVLGAKPNEAGEILLENPKKIAQFKAQLKHYYHIVLVVDINSKVKAEPSDRIQIARIEDSIGEIDSLMAAREYLNTEYTTIVYADIEDKAFNYLFNQGITFVGDVFAGVLNLKTDMLLSMLQAADPSLSILEMASYHDLKVTVER